MKKNIVLTLAAIIAMSLVASTSYAATKVCFGATITRIGTTGASAPNSGHRLEVQGGTCNFAKFFPLWIHSDLGDAGLATALTSVSLGKKVTVKVPDPVGKNDLITAIHIEQ